MGNQQFQFFTYKSAVDGEDYNYHPDYNQETLWWVVKRGFYTKIIALINSGKNEYLRWKKKKLNPNSKFLTHRPPSSSLNDFKNEYTKNLYTYSLLTLVTSDDSKVVEGLDSI